MRQIVIAISLFALGGCQKEPDTADNEPSVAAPEQQVKGVDRSHKGDTIEATFNDPDGNETSLKAFAGKPALVNLWASWCAPCVKELPTLDRLAQAEEGKLHVLAISQDMAPHASVEAFLNEHKIASLDAYHDPKMTISAALGPDTVLPTSILYDAAGKEVWRYVGDLDWTSGNAAKLLAEAGVSRGR